MRRFVVYRFEDKGEYCVYSLDRLGVLDKLLWKTSSAEEVALRAAAEGIAGDFDKAVRKYAPPGHRYGWHASDERLPL